MGFNGDLVMILWWFNGIYLFFYGDLVGFQGIECVEALAFHGIWFDFMELNGPKHQTWWFNQQNLSIFQ